MATVMTLKPKIKPIHPQKLSPIIWSGLPLVMAVVFGLALSPTNPTGPTAPIASQAGTVTHPSDNSGATPKTNGALTSSTNASASALKAAAPQPASNLPLAAKQPAPQPGNKGYTEYPYSMLGTTNDTLLSNQWHLNTIQATSAWDRWTGSSSVTIAIIDTGFALNHEDLSAKWKLNSAEMGTTASQGPAPNCTSRGLSLDKRCNNVDDDGNGYTDDWRGWDFVAGDNDPQAGSTNSVGAGVSHGSFVAALAAAASNNGRGVAGVDRSAQILPLQALDDNGNGYTSTVAEAITYAADQGADVINLSLGSAYSDSYLRSQIDYAQSLGVAVVAAAGNDGCQECLSYPANFPEVIAVGATTSSDTLASFSSWGANLDLVAPGGSGLCSVAWSASNQTSGYSCGGQGTSFSSPLVTGTVGLIMGRQPGISLSSILTALQNGSDKVAAMNGVLTSTRYGYGRLNVYRSLQQLAQPVSVGGLGGNKDSSTPISLSSNQDVVTLCRGTVGNCRLRFTGPLGQVVLSPAANLNFWGDTAIQWQPADFSLTAGTWTMEPAWADGTASGYPGATLVISP
ncbi:hypothetical protein EPO04_02385 [Patescibacteria group bacterium]|nr:MAG: hypothetical protein EPO04_02385 [Patescibacteria group bacterium]